MKLLAVAFASIAMLTLTAGCAAQQLPPVPVVTAPPVTSTDFTQLNAGTTNGGPVIVTTYTDLPVTGSFCYFVQLLDGPGVSPASNTTCATTTTALKHVSLAWTPPVGYTCKTNPCTYVVSRAAAILTPVGSPTMTPSTTITQLDNRPPVDDRFKLQAIASR